MKPRLKDAVIVFRLPQATRDALERAAASEQRSKSNMLLRIVTEWLDAHPSEMDESKARRLSKRG